MKPNFHFIFLVILSMFYFPQAVWREIRGRKQGGYRDDFAHNFALIFGGAVWLGIIAITIVVCLVRYFFF